MPVPTWPRLQSSAVKDGDEWILNGQKVWTTTAHFADYGVVICRTDSDQPKHAGISMFIVDMKAPGMEIRPIHQIDGGSEFNEVFMTDVRVPADHLLGEYNNGWRMATAMLMYERVAIGTAGSGKVSQPTYKLLLKAAQENGKVERPRRAPAVDDDLLDGDHQGPRRAAHQGRAEGRQDPGPGWLARQAARLEHRLVPCANARSRSPARRPLRGSRTHENGDERQRIFLNSFSVVDRRRHRRDPTQHHR